jgi:ammonia channel protein AmtB
VRLLNSGAEFAPRVLSNGQVAFTASNTATATVAAALAGKVVRYHCQINDGTHALISGAIAGTTLTITASGSMTGKVYYDVLDVDVA